MAGIVEFNRIADLWLEKAGIAEVKEQLNFGEKKLEDAGIYSRGRGTGDP